MNYYLITCRSLTYAQKTAAALERAGITSHIIRSPKSIEEGGCGYSVKVSEHRLKDSLQVLRRSELKPLHIFVSDGEGNYHEVTE